MASLRFITTAIGWIADMSGQSLTIRTNRAREIAGAIKEGKQYRVEIKEYRKKRTLDQNALYWATLTELAKKLNVSNNYAHNMMLRRYGSVEDFDDFPGMMILPDTDETQKKVEESEDYHLKPTSEVRTGKDGKAYRTYLLLKGSHSMDTSEFSRLVDGLRDECRQVGVQMIYEE